MCTERNISTKTNSIDDREVLPTNVKPYHYDLTIEPDLENFTCPGTVLIEVEVKEKSDYITLNTAKTEIHEAKLNDVEVDDIIFDKKAETVTFKLKDNLVQGAIAKLHVKFTAEINNDMLGFYRSSYKEDGKTKYLASTQMEPADCRKAFPCFDEPSAKAKFSISIVCDKDLVALSNMDERECTLLGENKKKVVFNTTPLMSSYLVAYVIGDLKYIENNDFRVPIRVYTIPGSENLGHFAADIGAKSLKFFEEKFDIPYPLPKCDMISIPDFSSGAMENFGLITYRSSYLLLDPLIADNKSKMGVSEVVAHELAHQWFGNLVTMDFWDGLWLNEGFATWMSWYATDSFFPEWKVWEKYVSSSLQDALSLDALRSSHPVEAPVKKISEIQQIFDAISYNKGSVLLNMLSKWLGEDKFIAGVAKYLNDHKWGNTVTSDLWKALSDVSGKDILKVMDIWTKTIGYPVIHVTENEGEITVSQSRYLATGDVRAEDDTIIYPIFLGLKTSEGTDESLELIEKSKTIKLETTDDFFKLNANQSAMFRTAYAPSRWAKLGQSGKEGKLSVEDRVGLIADASSLATSGVISTLDLLNLIKLWKKESNHIVWSQISETLGNLRTTLSFEESNIIDYLNNFILDLTSEVIESHGWEISEKDSYDEVELKTKVFSLAAGAGHEKAVAYCSNAFKSYYGGEKSAIDPNLRMCIFNTVAKYGDEEVFEQLFKLYKDSEITEERIDILKSFGNFRDAKVLDKVTSLLLQFDHIKLQDIFYPLIGMIGHKTSILKKWEWLTTNWESIFEKVPINYLLGQVVSLSTTGLNTDEYKKDVENFFSDKDTEPFNQNLSQALDIITSKSKWASRDAKVIYTWLTDNGYQSS